MIFSVLPWYVVEKIIIIHVFHLDEKIYMTLIDTTKVHGIIRNIQKQLPLHETAFKTYHHKTLQVVYDSTRNAVSFVTTGYGLEGH